MGLDAGNPYTGSDEQLRKLKAAYTEMASIISSRDRARLKAYNKEALKAWSATTGDSEDDILLSLFSKDNVEGGKPECSPSGGTIMPSGL
ncbi:hypothetical protein O5466_16160 [Escherichia coli]|nr:hypothetical protein [Escherichia coli]